MLHAMEPERGTLHGGFGRDLEPVLTIDPGDTVRYRTLEAGWHLEPPWPDRPLVRFEPRDPERDAGHALCGPIAIKGARPGMVLGVRVDAVRPGPWGRTIAGGWDTELNRRLGVEGEKHRTTLVWTLDPDNHTGVDQHGHRVRLRPFMGVMGMPPDAPGRHSTTPPRACGGNIDCRELIAGSTLYIPIAVAGGLFSVGDGHAVQGDGEVSGVAIECPMDRVELTFSLHDHVQLRTPRAETEAGWITFGFHEDLDEATGIALEAMLELMDELYHFGRTTALALASLVVDLRVTQVVNGVKGVHAVLPHGALA
jgi:acetamidase/formamidase